MPRNPGDPQTVAGTFTVTPDESLLVLDALIGPTGNDGQPSPIIRPEWGSTITDPADLPEDLEESDEGRGWYIDGYWHIWTGTGWRVILGSLVGPPGPTPNITITAEQVVADDLTGPYGEVEVTESGTDTNPFYRLKIPGIVGPQGANSRITESDDVIGSPLDGQALVWDDLQDGVVWSDFTPYAAKLTSIPEYSFVAGTYSATRQVIATLEIPANDVAWYPDLDGHIRWSRAFLSFAQVEVEVRIENSGVGSPDTAPLCGKGLYDPSTLDAVTVSHIRPHFSDTSDPSRSVNPESDTCRIPVGQATTLYVILHKVGGSGNYAFAQSGAHLLLRQQPVS